MQDLADAVGIRKASLYSRFPDKNALIAQVLDLTLFELFPAEDEGVEGYCAALGRLAEHLASHRRCVALHLAYGLEGEGRDQVRAFFVHCVDRLAAALAPVAPPDQAREMAQDAIAALEGATLWLALGDDDAPLRRALAAELDRARALAVVVPSEAARQRLGALIGDWRRAGTAERQLAARLVEAEERVLFVEQALRGQIEADACFL